MPTPIIAGLGAVAGIGSALIGKSSGDKSAAAAESAANTQAAAQDRAIAEQSRQFDQIRQLLQPYVTAGSPDLTQPYIQAGPGALQGMQALAGLQGQDAQRQAIQGIEQGAQYQELAKQGEQGILQNASATGGLRGGNVQAALSQFRPALLNQLIEAQYGKLAGLTSLGSTSAQNLLGIGQASATGTAAAGQQSAQNIGNLMVGQGAAQAAGTIGAANAQAQGMGAISNALTGGFQNASLLSILGKGGTTGAGSFGLGSLFGGGNTALSMASPSATTMAGGTVGALIPGAY